MEIQVTPIASSQPQTAEPVATVPSIQHLAITSRYGIDIPSKQEDRQLQSIWQFAAEKAQSNDPQDIIWEVMNLEGTIGSPRLGESKLDRLHRYVSLRQRESQIQDELREVTYTGRLGRA